MIIKIYNRSSSLVSIIIITWSMAWKDSSLIVLLCLALMVKLSTILLYLVCSLFLTNQFLQFRKNLFLEITIIACRSLIIASLALPLVPPLGIDYKILYIEETGTPLLQLLLQSQDGHQESSGSLMSSPPLSLKLDA